MRPEAPLLVIWLSLAVLLGLGVSLWPGIGSTGRRIRWLVTIYAVLIAVSLITTQVAARRAISSTHLIYRGVHLAAVDSFTIGSNSSDADVRMATPSTEASWQLRLTRQGNEWEVEPVYGIEQLRIRNGSTEPITREFDVARSALVQRGDAVEVVDSRGNTVDHLRMRDGGVEGARGLVTFTPEAEALAGRYRRLLARGTSLSNLSATPSAPPLAYEHFVRIQELPNNVVVNGRALPFIQRLLPRAKRHLISAAPPFTLRGASLPQGNPRISTSAFVEVRSADIRWRFAVLTEWRREPGAERGVAVLFDRNPKPMDTPLPVGVSCRAGAACSAISLRRLPPPVAHIALDQAGFDPQRFGMLSSGGSARRNALRPGPPSRTRVLSRRQPPDQYGANGDGAGDEDGIPIPRHGAGAATFGRLRRTE
jgi:hypothetical protein